MEESIRTNSWFPRGICNSLEVLDESPPGFKGWNLATTWGSFNAYEIVDLSIALNEGKSWGKVPETFEIINQDSCSFELDSKGDFWRAEHLPFTDGLPDREFLRELSEAPCGGIRFKGQDLLLFWKGKKPGIPLTKALAEDSEAAAEALGDFLGECATAAMQKVSLNNDERVWNDRLKEMEDRLSTNTLWRAPHSPDTRGTSTFRHLRPEHITISNGKLNFSGVWGGLESQILGMSPRRPAIADLGAAFALIHEHCPKENRDQALRSAGLVWSKKAPKRLSSRRALDAHLGGLHIWVYEAMLNRLCISRALGEEDPSFISHHLQQVGTMQAGMFQARSWSALALMSFSTAVLVPTAWVWGYVSASQILLAPVFLFAGLWFREVYRSKAPSCW